MFEEEKIEKLFEFILVYADSVETTDPKDKRSEKARELHKYLNNNKEGLLPYQKQGKEIPAPKEGIIYKNMGVQESQNCTVITLRMKHRRMRWSVKGANNLAKVLCRKENKELCSTIERYTDGLIFTSRMNEIIETLSVAKVPKTDGKGNPYVEVLRGHVALLDAATTASRKVFRDAFIRYRKTEFGTKGLLSNVRYKSFQDSSNARRKDLKRVGTNTQVSDMRILHVDTSAHLS